MIESNTSTAVPDGTDSPIDGTEKPGRQPSKRRLRRTYSRHDLTTLKKAVKVLGTRTVDRRTSVGKALAEFRADLVASLGGQDSVTTQQQVIVDLVVRQKLILDSIDAWILSQPNLVNLRKRALLPVVRERQALADALARYLGQLGLERRAKRLPDLKTYLATTATEGTGSPDGQAEGNTSSPSPPARANTDGPEAEVGNSNP